MTTSLRLVGGSADQSAQTTNSPLVRAEHDQKYVVRNADRELDRLIQLRPDLRDRLTSLRDDFSTGVAQAGQDFRAAGGQNYLGFAQNLARMRRELSSSLRSVIQQSPAPNVPASQAAKANPLPFGRLDIRG